MQNIYIKKIYIISVLSLGLFMSRVEDNLDSTRELMSRVESESQIQFRVKNPDLESTREQLESTRDS